MLLAGEGHLQHRTCPLAAHAVVPPFAPVKHKFSCAYIGTIFVWVQGVNLFILSSQVSLLRMNELCSCRVAISSILAS